MLTLANARFVVQLVHLMLHHLEDLLAQRRLGWQVHLQVQKIQDVQLIVTVYVQYFESFLVVVHLVVFVVYGVQRLNHPKNVYLHSMLTA